MVKWLSSSETDPGSLVLSNFSTEPPTPAEAAPEYFINLNRRRMASKAVRRKASIFPKHPADSETVGNESPGADESKRRRSGVPSPAAVSSSVQYNDENHPEEARKAYNKRVTPKNTRSERLIRASKFQVWCLGTIWLQLVTWFLLGPDGTKYYGHIFNPHAHRSGFVDAVSTGTDTSDSFNSYKLKTSVRILIDRLEGHEDSTPFIRQLLWLIEFRMLEVNADLRASSWEIVNILEDMERSVAEVAGQEVSS